MTSTQGTNLLQEDDQNMKRRTLMLVSVLFIAVLLATTAWWILADTGTTPVTPPRTDNTAADGQRPDYLAPVYKFETKPGIYVWGGPYRGLLPEGNENLGTTFPIRGHVAAFNWDSLVDVDPSTGHYIWYFGSIDAWLREQCDRPGIKPKDRFAAFYIVPYTSSPAPGTKHLRIPRYMYDPSNPYSNPDEARIPYDFGGTSPDDGIPKYWSSYFQAEYAKLIAQLGRKYRDRGNCLGFIGIGTGRDGETAPADMWSRSDLRALLRSSGLTSDGWVAYVNRVTELYVQAFSGVNCEGPNHLCVPLLLQAAPYYLAPSERKRFTDYAASLGVGVSINGLYPEQTGAIMGDGTGMYEPLLRHPDVPGSFETYLQNFACTTEEWSKRHIYWAVINALDKHIDFLRPKVDLLLKPNPNLSNPYDYPCPWAFCQYPEWQVKWDNVHLLKWMSKYLGVTRDTTPDVWVALREHREPFNVCWKSNTAQIGFQQGNYSFWLYQEDIPTGITVPETNANEDQFGIPVNRMGLNLNPYNPNLPDIKEAWYIRRTDAVNGSPYMFFNVDDGYLYGGSATVTVTVTYIDMYTDTFSLHYQALDAPDKPAKLVALYEVPHIYEEDKRTPITITVGSTVVQKEGTKTLRQAVFLLENAHLMNGLPLDRGGMDFYIDSNGDGDEWIHMVSLTYDKDTFVPEPTPTPSPTPTVTPTPSPTPSPTPTTARVEGVVWNDLNQNILMESGEPPIAGVRVKLLDQTTLTERYSDVTDDVGMYEFPAVEPGSYVLKVIPPDGYEFVLPPSPDYDNGYPLGALAAGQSLTWNVALHQLPTPTPTVTPTPTTTPTPTATPTPAPPQLTGTVFVDANGNGVRDAGEETLAHVRLSLYRIDGSTRTPVTTVESDEDGLYSLVLPGAGSFVLVQDHVAGYIPSTGYEQTFTAAWEEDYTVDWPNRPIAARHWIPLHVER